MSHADGAGVFFTFKYYTSRTKGKHQYSPLISPAPLYQMDTDDVSMRSMFKKECKNTFFLAQ